MGIPEKPDKIDPSTAKRIQPTCDVRKQFDLSQIEGGGEGSGLHEILQNVVEASDGPFRIGNVWVDAYLGLRMANTGAEELGDLR